MRLAAHLCGSHVNDILNGNNNEFISTLVNTYGFGRLQINATAVNGVDTSNLSNCIALFMSVIVRYPKVEFIIQKNEETRCLWEGLLSSGDLPNNVSMLVDESKGTGVLSKSWPKPPKDYNIGYAGGIGPDNISNVLDDIIHVASGYNVWIDMESSLRSIKNGIDIFDLNKCYQCIKIVCDKKLHCHPSFL